MSSACARNLSRACAGRAAGPDVRIARRTAREEATASGYVPIHVRFASQGWQAMLFDQAPSESEAGSSTRLAVKSWVNLALIVGLITGSTFSLLLVPCIYCTDYAFHDAMLALSIVIGICATIMLYRRWRQESEDTPFITAMKAGTIVVFGVLLEIVALICLIWLIYLVHSHH
jgi:hypothetical protein